MLHSSSDFKAKQLWHSDAEIHKGECYSVGFKVLPTIESLRQHARRNQLMPTLT